MKKPLLLSLVLLFAVSSWAKDAYNIKVKINGLPNAAIQLAYYYGDKQYIKKEESTNINGEVVFKGDTALPTGAYLIVLPESKYFEFLVEEQFFSISADYNDEKIIVETLRAEKSPQNSRFFVYNSFLLQKKEEAEALKALLDVYSKNQAKKSETEDLNKKLQALDDELLANQNNIIKEFKGKLFSKLLLAAKRPIIPQEITENNARFYYYREHFWDDFDFAYASLLYTPTYSKRIKEYIDNLTINHYDSVFQSVDYIIQRSKANKEMFKYTVMWALNEYAKTKTVCFDAVYVNIANKYYVSGQADWVEKDQLEKIIENAKALSKILCGQKAPDIKAKTESYATPSLYKVTSKYTAVFIWDADCGHCKGDARELKNVYNTYKDKGFTVYSVEIGGDKDKWQKFTTDEAIGWINLQQTSMATDVRKEYDVKSTPQLFLLDENKAIVYKRIDPAQLTDLLVRLLN